MGGQHCEGASSQAPIRSLPVWSGTPVAARTPGRQVNFWALSQWNTRVRSGFVAATGRSLSRRTVAVVDTHRRLRLTVTITLSSARRSSWHELQPKPTGRLQGTGPVESMGQAPTATS
jgi:hypothetical protein